MSMKLDITGMRRVVATLEDYRSAVCEVTNGARLSLCIYTPDLEPLLYDQDCFLEPVKRLVLARSHGRVRVLICEPIRAAREGRRLMQMAIRLSSCVALRTVPAEHRDHPYAYIMADNKAIAYRPNAARWVGFVEHSDEGINRRHSEHFEQVWALSWAISGNGTSRFPELGLT
jgi:hypothetical protein